MKTTELIDWQDIKDAPLGHVFVSADVLRKSCEAIIGGVAWPGQNPGFGIVVAMNSFEHFGKNRHEICLLDQIESGDTWELIQKCNGLDLSYRPSVWIGDNLNPMAWRVLQEAGRESQRKTIKVMRPSFLDLERPYEYMVLRLRRLLDKDNRELFLKDSNIDAWLRQVDSGDERTLEIGAFPAIEALAFAVFEAKDYSPGITLDRIRELQRSAGMLID